MNTERETHNPPVKNGHQLVQAVSVAQYLDVKEREARRWIADGRIPTVSFKSFRNSYRTYTTSLRDPEVLECLKEKIAAWRADDTAQQQQRRKHAASIAAATRKKRDAENPDKLRLRRGTLRVKSLLRQLGTKVSFENAPTGPCLVFRIEVELPQELKRDLLLRCALPPGLTNMLSGGGGALKQADKRRLVEQTVVAMEEARSAAESELGEELGLFQENLESFMERLDKRLGGPGKTPQASLRLDALITRFKRTLEQRIRPADPQGLPAPELAAWAGESLRECLSLTLTEWGQENFFIEQREWTGLQGYADLFPEARRLKRELIFHVGPTNSGKTHAAMERLAAARNGAYLAPLRLMALENFERLNEQGTLTDLVTGEEVRRTPGALHTASTIEMADFTRRVEVAVIDEIQMIADHERGWAWTQAVIGMPADVVIMTGSAEALPWLQKALSMTGEKLTIREFQRKSPLSVAPVAVSPRELRAGDAVVAFSRRAVLELRQELLLAGKSVATIYGALGPEVRSQQAARFRSGEAEVLVATDAIGMGLNLPIRRIFFSEGRKFDGRQMREILPSEIRQIAGRAGRFGLAETGEVGVLRTASDFLKTLEESLTEDHPLIAGFKESTADKRLSVMPPWSAVQETGQLLKTEHLGTIMKHLCRNLIGGMSDLRSPDIEGILRIAARTEETRLPLRTRFSYLGCPVDTGDDTAMLALERWAHWHGVGTIITSDHLLAFFSPFAAEIIRSAASFKGEASDDWLAQCERAVKNANAYLWLAMRWPDSYSGGERAREMRETLNLAIEQILATKVIARSCRECGDRLPKRSPHAICEGCFQARRFRPRYAF